jgi:hypothetical protein
MLALAAILMSGSGIAQTQPKVLRVVPQGEVKGFDPPQ